MGWERRRDMRDMMGDGLVVAAWEVCVVAVAVVAVQCSAVQFGFGQKFVASKLLKF